MVWVLVIALLALVGWFLAQMVPGLTVLLANPFNERRFDRQVWLAATHETGRSNQRGPMAEDLRRRILNRGLSRSKVEAILGKPSGAAPGLDEYYLGNWGPFSIEADYLRLHYDSGKRLTSTEIYSH